MLRFVLLVCLSLCSLVHAAPPKVSSITIGSGATRSRVDTIAITIDQVVSVPVFSVVVRNRDANQVVGFKQVAVITNFQSGTTVISATFMGTSTAFESLSNANYDVTLDAEAIKNAGNDQLDGDGDGTGGDDYVFGDVVGDKFYRMYGDADGDGDVDGTDFATHFIPAYGTTSTDAAYRRDLDYEGDGDIDGTDFSVYFLPAFGSVRSFM